jgi:hypothetical protein
MESKLADWVAALPQEEVNRLSAALDLAERTPESTTLSQPAFGSLVAQLYSADRDAQANLRGPRQDDRPKRFAR